MGGGLGIHISLATIFGIHISLVICVRRYTYHCDTGTSTLWISCPRLAGDWAGLLWKCITGYLVYVQDGGGELDDSTEM